MLAPDPAPAPAPGEPDLDPVGPVDLDELTALALAAGPDVRVAEDAVPDPLLAPGRASGLPTAYLPGSAPGEHSRRFRLVVLLIIAALLTITAAGFCNTYGSLVFA